MFCLQTFEVWQPLKPPADAPKVSYSNVFDQRFPPRLIFHFSQLLGLFLAQKQHTCLQKLFLTSKKFCAKNILLSENKSSRQQPPTPNFECLAAKHVNLRPCFFLTCTRFDVTDGIFKKAKRYIRINWIPKIMGQFWSLRPYEGIGIVSDHLLLRMARMDVD